MVVVLQLGHLILRGQHFYDAEIPVQGHAENGADGAGIIDVGRLGFGSKKFPMVDIEIPVSSARS